MCFFTGNFLLNPQNRSLIYMVYGSLAVLITMGWTYISLVLSHCIILYSVALVKRKWLCFVAGLTSLATFKMEPFNTWQVRKSIVIVSSFIMPLIRFGPIDNVIFHCKWLTDIRMMSRHRDQMADHSPHLDP